MVVVSNTSHTFVRNCTKRVPVLVSWNFFLLLFLAAYTTILGNRRCDSRSQFLPAQPGFSMQGFSMQYELRPSRGARQQDVPALPDRKFGSCVNKAAIEGIRTDA